jgi:two-component system, NtrC family, sensor histidine kinase HydH
MNREWVPVVLLFVLGMLGSAAECLWNPPQFSLGRTLTSLYYLPIIAAALKFGPKTAFGVAIAAGACNAVAAAAGSGDSWSQVLSETILFVSAGLLTGKLAEWQPGTLAGPHAVLPRDAGQALERTFKQVRPSEMPALVQMEVGLVRQFLTPVASIQGASWVLEEPRLPEEKREEFVAIIRKESHRLDRSLANLLSFTQPRKPRQREVNLALLLDDVTRLAKPTEHGPYFLFRMDAPPGLPSLRGDLDQIKQMLLNVVMNSIEATPGGGEIEIAVRTGRDDVIIRITDHGRGISPEILGRICEPFFTTRDNSLGLGLTVARQIAAAHGGRITVESASCEGTSVSIELPLSERIST